MTICQNHDNTVKIVNTERGFNLSGSGEFFYKKMSLFAASAKLLLIHTNCNITVT